MNIVPLIIQLVSGALGGNIAGGLLKKLSLGKLWNSIVGIVGGGLGGQILGMLGMGATGDAGSALDVGNILQSVAAGGVGGGALMGIIGAVKGVLGKGK